MLVRVAFLLLLLSVPAFAKPIRQFESGKVVSQELSSEDGGYAVIPIGTGLVGAPITRRSNVVVVETVTERFTWMEAGRSSIILPVHGTIQFYRDGKWFVILGSSQKKHKFGLMHMEVISAGVK